MNYPTNEASGEWTAAEAGLIDQARALAPMLRERAGIAEEIRRIPDETHAVFRDAGFYRVLQPARYGGLEARYGLHTMLAAEIARGCASSAWALSVTACHAWILGMFPRLAQDEFWSHDPARAVASSFLPVGPKLSPESGGIRLSGRWRFSSNVDHCDGAILLAMVPGPAGVAPHFLLLHRGQYEIEDTWRTVGLAATGSNDIVVSDALVPAHRMLDVIATRDGRAPGAQVNASHLYRLPLFACLPHSLIGAALGAALGAVDQIVADLAGRSSVASLRLAEQQTIQARIAEAAAELEAARALLQVDRARINDMGRSLQLPDTATRLQYRLNVGYAAKLCVQAVERLMPVVGGRGLELHHAFQRAWRDVHAVAQHIALVWDVQALNYAAARLGLAAGDPKI
ncbi:MAG TPA: acyl-CoA dehydrogenase family protein [Xanthobacteraceae bacterium]|nr:acyl-CoA dehydrogenase family protein [Xanthobacteraceae bacterium]